VTKRESVPLSVRVPECIRAWRMTGRELAVRNRVNEVTVPAPRPVLVLLLGLRLEPPDLDRAVRKAQPLVRREARGATAWGRTEAPTAPVKRNHYTADLVRAEVRRQEDQHARKGVALPSPIVRAVRNHDRSAPTTVVRLHNNNTHDSLEPRGLAA
jgi:hypothetical protein